MRREVNGQAFTMPDGKTGGRIEDLEEYFALDSWREVREAEILLNERLYYAEARDFTGETKIHTHLVRAKLAGGEAKLSAADWRDIKRAFGNRCAYCRGKTMTLCLEHVDALCNGGGTTRWNVVPACMACNAKKGTKAVEDWLSPESLWEFVALCVWATLEADAC